MNLFACSDTHLNVDARQTVQRGLVHRSALSEVFITDGIRLEGSHLQCAAQLPRTNLYFNDVASVSPYYDMAVIVEVFRQASIYVSHVFLGVEPTDKFLYLDSRSQITDLSLLSVRRAPTHAVVDVIVVDEYVRRGVRQGVTLDMRLLIDGQTAATHHKMSIRWMNKAAWGRMREKGLSRLPDRDSARCPFVIPAQPVAVGRRHPGNVVVSELTRHDAKGSVTELVIPFDNGAIFDHPLDHIPGMLLLEGFRQTALQAIDLSLGVPPERLVLADCTLSFQQFAEFGFSSRIYLNDQALSLAADGRRISCPQIVVEQQEEVIATSSMIFAVPTETAEVLISPAFEVVGRVEP